MAELRRNGTLSYELVRVLKTYGQGVCKYNKASHHYFWEQGHSIQQTTHDRLLSPFLVLWG